MPELGALMNFSSVVEPTALVSEDVEPIARERIRQLHVLLRPYGARLVVLLPPLLGTNAGTKEGTGYLGIMRAARSNGVTAMMPVDRGVFGTDMYRDGFHLNATGAAEFTTLLTPALRSELATLVARGPAAGRSTRPICPFRS